MTRLLALSLLVGCKVTVEPLWREDAPATEAEPTAAATTRAEYPFDRRLGITDYGDVRALQVDQGYLFSMVCKDEPIVFTFEAHDDVHGLSCGTFSTGIRNAGELHVMREGEASKEIVRPFEVCGDGHARLTFPPPGENVQHATLFCPRDGSTHPFPEGWWYRYEVVWPIVGEN